jgi:NADP-dependent 3-hydroxy acid dehydrogenase YdfG
LLAGSYEDLRRQPSQIDVDVIERLSATYLLTPVALVGRVLTGMLARGDGALLFALGAAAEYPFPNLASAGIVGSGLRSYAHTLHAELAAPARLRGRARHRIPDRGQRGAPDMVALHGHDAR